MACWREFALTRWRREPTLRYCRFILGEQDVVGLTFGSRRVDHGSIMGLHELLLAHEPVPMLVLLSQRDTRPARATVLGPLLGSLREAGVWRTAEVVLDALNPADTRRLIERSLPEDTREPAAVIAALAAEAGGNPFIARELARFVQTGPRPAIPVELLPEEVKRLGLDAFEQIGVEETRVVEHRKSSLVVQGWITRTPDLIAITDRAALDAQ